MAMWQIRGLPYSFEAVSVLRREQPSRGPTRRSTAVEHAASRSAVRPLYLMEIRKDGQSRVESVRLIRLRRARFLDAAGHCG